MTDIYLPLNTIEVPQDNDAYLIFDFQDEGGNLLDLTGTQEIVFTVYDERGGTQQFTKTYTGGDIVIAGNDYQFMFWIDAADTDALTQRLNYHECKVTNSSGRARTVSAGVFRAERTYI